MCIAYKLFSVERVYHGCYIHRVVANNRVVTLSWLAGLTLVNISSWMLWL